ncbi:unnamed protein product [Urochloa humidicola]
MANGSLDDHLFRRSKQPLSWGLRLRIAIGSARGLAFLHSEKHLVIYRDIKASNILLDTHFNAKLSDFGHARSGPADISSHVSTGASTSRRPCSEWPSWRCIASTPMPSADPP